MLAGNLRQARLLLDLLHASDRKVSAASSWGLRWEFQEARRSDQGGSASRVVGETQARVGPVEPSAARR